MNITVNVFKENEDGSALCEVEMDEAAKRYLIERGFITMLQTALDKDPDWWTEQDEKRMDVVGANGNDGLHYD